MKQQERNLSGIYARVKRNEKAKRSNQTSE